jgi:hypothetical protein
MQNTFNFLSPIFDVFGSDKLVELLVYLIGKFRRRDVHTYGPIKKSIAGPAIFYIEITNEN